MNSEEFKNRLNALPPMLSLPEPFTWDRHRYELRKHAIKDNPDELLIWSTIRATMFVGQCELTDKEMNHLESSSNWEFWRNVIGEPKFGSPPMFRGWTSGNLVHQAFHLEMSEKDISSMSSVVEFGGGYGALALICTRINPRLDYTIIDLPEFSIVQEYYLSNVGCIANYKSREELEYTEVDLLIGCYSLSEVKDDVRNDVLNKVLATHYLFVIQDAYDGVKLLYKFREVTDNIEGVTWNWTEHPYMPGHYYITGRRTQ